MGQGMTWSTHFEVCLCQRLGHIRFLHRGHGAHSTGSGACALEHRDGLAAAVAAVVVVGRISTVTPHR